MAKMNYSKRNKLDKPQLSLKDEKEKKDIADKWLEKHDTKKK